MQRSDTGDLRLVVGEEDLDFREAVPPQPGSGHVLGRFRARGQNAHVIDAEQFDDPGNEFLGIRRGE